MDGLPHLLGEEQIHFERGRCFSRPSPLTQKMGMGDTIAAGDGTDSASPALM
jgi:hypothetical protein